MHVAFDDAGHHRFAAVVLNPRLRAFERHHVITAADQCDGVAGDGECLGKGPGPVHGDEASGDDEVGVGHALILAAALLPP